MSFLIKICGCTRPEDAALACLQGAGAIGINLWSGSQRFVEDSQAREILAAVAPGVLKVGVFVNPHPLAVSESMAELRLDMVQFHGEELAAAWTDPPGERIIRRILAIGRHRLEPALLPLRFAFPGLRRGGKGGAVGRRGQGRAPAIPAGWRPGPV